jgi:ribosome-associated protein
MEDLFVNNRLTIPASQLIASYSRSGGPGGQNVNKVSSKVTLRWHVDEQPLLPPGWRNRLWAQYGNRISREGELIIHSDRYRDQPRNMTDCRARLVEILLSCAAPPVIRKKTAPSVSSQRRRMDDKRKQGEKKSGRRDPGMD